ncbi:hypothetical protein ACP4OV_028579 [Aristida adscensionis]
MRADPVRSLLLFSFFFHNEVPIHAQSRPPATRRSSASSPATQRTAPCPRPPSPMARREKKARTFQDGSSAPVPPVPQSSSWTAPPIDATISAAGGLIPGALGGSPRMANPSQGNQLTAHQWPYPPGGFLNYLQPQFSPFAQGPQAPENFHFVGVPPNFGAFSSPPPAPVPKGTPSPAVASTKGRSQKQKENVPIDIDNDKEAETEKKSSRMHWTHEEEVRLASAWLNNSNDPINGTCKKNEKFWGDVTDAYNSNTPEARRRDMNQLKQHWQRLKTVIGHFNGVWNRTVKRHGSGMSDDQMMDEALKMHEQETGKAFTLVHWWRQLKNQPKWCAHLELMEKEKNKSPTAGLGETPDAPNEHLKRPIGRDAARAERDGKRKSHSQEAVDGVVLLGEQIDKVVEVQNKAHLERQKTTEAQQRMSSERLEAARRTETAARDQKDAARDQKESKMLEVFNSLLTQDTSGLSEEAKAIREKAIASLSSKLFDN